MPLLEKDGDVTVMKNGDRFPCEIKALSAGLSVTPSYLDGTIAEGDRDPLSLHRQLATSSWASSDRARQSEI
jgi:hypothetical protein